MQNLSENEEKDEILNKNGNYWVKGLVDMEKNTEWDNVRFFMEGIEIFPIVGGVFVT